MVTKAELEEKLAGFAAAREKVAAEQARIAAEMAEIEQKAAYLRALESDRQRVVDAHDSRRQFCVSELELPLAERSYKDHSTERRDDEAIRAELNALAIDCARIVAVHDEQIRIFKAQEERGV